MNSSSKIGVIVGRFQVDCLHEGHRKFIETVIDLHQTVIILIGTRDSGPLDSNPMNFSLRAEMIREDFPDVMIMPLEDRPTDEEWSSNLDAIIRNVADRRGAVLYTGRDGFAKHYTGKYSVEEIVTGVEDISATKIRKELALHPKKNSVEFRQGIIYAMQQMYPRVFETVDVALIDWSNQKILMARKPHSTQWRFPGGFAHFDEPLVNSAARELKEETGMVAEGGLTLLGERRIEDWRLRDTKTAAIRTFFYVGDYSFGFASAADDIEEVKWFPLGVVCNDACAEKTDERDYLVHVDHRPLISGMLVDYIKSRITSSSTN